MQTHIWQTDEPSRTWCVAMLCLVCNTHHSAERRTHSGIVKAAKFFHAWGCRCRIVSTTN